MLKITTVKTAIAALLCTLSIQAHALDDQWYLGIGGGISDLTPSPTDVAVERTEEQGDVGTLILGRDFDDRSSGQFQLYSLGDTDFSNGESVTYSAAEAALLYRFYDTRDNQRGDGIFGASLYGRFGLGYIDRDSGVELGNESSVYFGAGGGIETYFTNNVGVRAEFQYSDSDAIAGTVSLIGRFGGLRRDLARRPPPISTQVAAFPSAQDDSSDSLDTSDVTGTAGRNTPATPQVPQSTPTPSTPPLEPVTTQIPSVELPETYQAPNSGAAPQVLQTTPAPVTAAPDPLTTIPPSVDLPETYQAPGLETAPTTGNATQAQAQAQLQPQPQTETQARTPAQFMAEMRAKRQAEALAQTQPQVPSPAQTSQLPEANTRVPDAAPLPETYQAPQTASNPATPPSSSTISAQALSNALPSVEIMVDPERPDTLAQERQDTPLPLPAERETAQVNVTDTDADRVPNELDECSQSPQGFPVDNRGCPLLQGDVTGLEYESDSTTLLEGTTENLDYLASLLTEYPQARIELHAYTDNLGSTVQQSQRTRGRLRSIGLYLVDKGVLSRQLVLRSFGAENPAYNNATPAGRRANNRIEISESPR